ncbi:hypothetical protein Goshw_028310 [Gossypium schwendimanii]|uniref:Glutaredoxin domain-containing protein n=1 Tax=Gossypium schwendimanii TaxID=34291 RepID=A0A7J9MQ99_GOSSC|nr:hypothetical protein [Gossypium schwendimanii]
MHCQTGSWGSYVPTTRTTVGDPLERIERLASENAVVIFSISSCCMCHAIKRLFCGMGVNPTVYELDQDPRGKDMEKALMRLLGSSPAVPVVFIGGKLVGTMDRVMASHINGTLVPLLKQAEGINVRTTIDFLLGSTRVVRVDYDDVYDFVGLERVICIREREAGELLVMESYEYGAGEMDRNEELLEVLTFGSGRGTFPSP